MHMTLYEAEHWEEIHSTVFVTATIDKTVEVDAVDEEDAMSLAEDKVVQC